MQTLQRENISKHPKLIFLCIILYCALIANMTINSASLSGSSYIGSLILAFFICCSLPIGAMTNCIFMTIPFIAVLKLPIEAFSFFTLLQSAFIAKSLLTTCDISIQKIISISIIAFLTQTLPIFFASQTISNIILLLLNILTFYCAFKLSEKSKINITESFFSFSIGVLIGGLISLQYGIHVSDMQEIRFSGLWTDPNFWGMFCLIGIVTNLIIGFERPVLFLITLPIIIILGIQGILTLSRTFIVVCSLMTLVISWNYLKRSKWGSLFVIGILCAGIIIALPYAIEIFSVRTVKDDDISNGRFNRTLQIFSFMLDNWEFLLFGFGYNNILNVLENNHFTEGASHNSYADIFVDFGLLWVLIFLWLLNEIKRQIYLITQNIFTLAGLVFCVIIFYMGTLSMLKYALLFLFGGVYIGYINSSHPFKQYKRITK